MRRRIDDGLPHAPLQIVRDAGEPKLETGIGVAVKVAAVIGVDTFFNSQSPRLAALALMHSIPAMYQYREFVAAGGLVS